MLLNEIAPSRTQLEYHQTLNKKLWDDDMQLHDDVREALENIVNAFMVNLKVDKSKILDILLTGSNANYNWSSLSDIDIHIILDYGQICKDCIEGGSGFDLDDCFNAKKSLWNNGHDITVKGHDVELYVAPNTMKPTSNAGVYSLLNHEWLQLPVKENVVYNENEIMTKAEELMIQIDAIEDTDNTVTIKKLQDKIRKMRKAALLRGGEFSLENLVFKTLRNNGYMKKLYDKGYAVKDNELSLK